MHYVANFAFEIAKKKPKEAKIIFIIYYVFNTLSLLIFLIPVAGLPKIINIFSFLFGSGIIIIITFIYYGFTDKFLKKDDEP